MNFFNRKIPFAGFQIKSGTRHCQGITPHGILDNPIDIQEFDRVQGHKNFFPSASELGQGYHIHQSPFQGSDSNGAPSISFFDDAVVDSRMPAWNASGHGHEILATKGEWTPPGCGQILVSVVNRMGTPMKLQRRVKGHNSVVRKAHSDQKGINGHGFWRVSIRNRSQQSPPYANNIALPNVIGQQRIEGLHVGGALFPMGLLKITHGEHRVCCQKISYPHDNRLCVTRFNL